METIQEPVSNVLKILGEPKAAPDGWRWTNHLVFQEVGEGTLAFNTLTRELALLSPEEFGSPDECLELQERWFRVPASTDDKSSADLVRLVLESLHQRPEHVTTYHVFTTMDCNARCFYCYEKDRARPTMSVGTAHKTADYIVRHCGGNKVRLAWFGGEPLYNAQVIDLICNDLVERGIGYESSMISNGFLFDEKLIKRAAELWRLRQIQITLDGTEGVYNAVKRYVDAGEKSPYQVVLANIRGLLDAGVRVIVRLNVSRANAKNLLALVDDLEARFAGARLLSVYCALMASTSSPWGRMRPRSSPGASRILTCGLSVRAYSSAAASRPRFRWLSAWPTAEAPSRCCPMATWGSASTTARTTSWAASTLTSLTSPWSRASASAARPCRGAPRALSTQPASGSGSAPSRPSACQRRLLWQRPPCKTEWSPCTTPRRSK